MAQISPLSAQAMGPVAFPPVTQPALIPTPPPQAPTPRALAGMELRRTQPRLENLFTGAAVEQGTLSLMGPAQSLYPAPLVFQPIIIGEREPAAGAPAAAAPGSQAPTPRQNTPPAAGAAAAAGPGDNPLAALETAQEIIALSELGAPSIANFRIASDAYLLEIQAQDEMMNGLWGPGVVQREWFG